MVMPFIAPFLEFNFHRQMDRFSCVVNSGVFFSDNIIHHGLKYFKYYFLPNKTDQL